MASRAAAPEEAPLPPGWRGSTFDSRQNRRSKMGAKPSTSMSNQDLAVGIDIGGTNTRIGLVDRTGVLRRSVNIPTETQAPAGDFLHQLASQSLHLLDQAAVARDRVAGIGVGCPGPLSPSRGVVFGPANLPTWKDVAVCRALSEKTSLPVVLDNDANAAAWGEYQAGAGRGVRDLVLLTLGTGIGGGVITGGRLLHGHFENAAELGHMIVVPAGRACNCGQRGCLEAYASAHQTARRAEEALAGQPHSFLRPVLEETGRLVCEDVVAAARQGDDLAGRIWEETCQCLAVACVNLQHAFNPARIILGGGMAGSGDILLTPVRQALARLTWKLCDDRPEIVLAELGNDAGLIGAAGLVFEVGEPSPAS